MRQHQVKLKKIISEFSISKSTGVNSIPTRILKDNANIFSQILSNLINLSFNKGVFPKLLKVAKIIPIYKRGDTLIAQTTAQFHCSQTSVKFMRNTCILAYTGT